MASSRSSDAARRRPRAVLVLGMHRSGTSALARVLGFRGAKLPRHLMPANAGNPSGYWEPRPVVDFNDRLLAYFGVDWDDPFAPLLLPPTEAIPDRFRNEAIALVREEFRDADLFVLKDPRCTLLAGFWHGVLEEAGFDASPVVMARPFEEVADSLRRRDGTPVAGGVLLSIAYAMACLDFLERHPGTPVVTYSELLADWASTTDAIARAHSFSWPRSGAAVGTEVEAFLVAGPVHVPTGSLPARLAAWSDQVWNALAAPAAADAARDVSDVAEGLAELADLAAPFVARRSRRIRELEADVSRLEEVESRLHGLFEESQAALRTAAGDRDRFQTERDALLARAEALESDKSDLSADIARRDEEVAGLQAGVAMLQSQRDALEAETAALAGELARRAGGREKLQVERDALEAETAALAGELARRAGEVEQLLAQRDALEGERVRLQDELEAAAAVRSSLEDAHERLCRMHEDALVRLDRAEDRSRQYEAAFSETQGELARIHSSRSWRLTSPLRRAGDLARNVFGRDRAAGPPRFRLAPPVEAVSPVALPATTPGGAPGASAPTSPAAGWAPSSHHALRGFLHEEFGAQSVEETIARINTYRLVVDVGDGRRAGDASCDADEARVLMQAMAARAPGSALSADPVVSIVVPVYGQLRHTLACLDALIGQRTRYPFEVLVGDDASTDATAAAFEVAIPGIGHVRHPSNLGFVRNCNATAARARGRHLVFLNNDTLVLPGWLDELVGTLESDPRIGLAGSKLVYPDGRLQESGAIVWRDGSAWNFGRFDDPRRPEYCYLRDVDYVSGASIALPRVLWDELGGFDEAFVPAYAEDADLAFRVRAAGRRTVVQPLSQLLHFEGVSSGTDTGQGAKAHQVENLRKLHARWKDVLAGHRSNAESPELEKERAVCRRVLFIDHVTPTPNADAGSLVAWEVMSAFRALGYKVTFIPEDNFAHMGADTAALQRVGIEPIYHPAYSRMRDFLKARQDPFDVVFLHRYGVGDAHMTAMRRHFPDARLLFLNADMHFLRELREADVNGDPEARAAALRTRERELAVIRGADCALVHSDVELAMLEEVCAGARVHLFPLVHDPVEDTPGLEAREGLCFIGGFRHPPNVDGVLWFVGEVWPRVRARIPAAQFHIAGSHMPPEIVALGGTNGVEVAGFVEDLEGFLAARRATVAPLRYGAGAKGKVASALAHGVPTAGTAIAMEGMGLRAGRDVLVANDPEGLADAVVALLEDDALWMRMRGASLDFASRVTARCHAHQRMAMVLAQVGAPGAGPTT